MPPVADDSGLAVDALNGMPGVLSARWAGVNGSRAERDRANNDLLLAQLADVPDERRTAAFHCCVVLAVPSASGDPAVHEFEVDGSRHALVDLGEAGGWDGERAARDLEKIVRENRRLWGPLPFKRYLFLNVFRRGAAASNTRTAPC